MKNFKLLFSAAVASALIGCSSMDVDDEEALAGNFPADFSDAAYVQLHPELVRVQIKDFVASYNTKFADAAKAAGNQAMFDSTKEADVAKYAANTEMLHTIMVSTQLGGFTEADWEKDWAGGTKDSIFASETRKDTLILAIDDSTDAAAPTVTLVYFGAKKGAVTGKIDYAEDGTTITAVHGYKKCDKTSCTDSLDVEITEKMSFNKKGTKVETDTLKLDTISVPTEGAISAAHMKVLNQLNFYGVDDDLTMLQSVAIDTFAITYQYVMFGKAHGWAYRACTEAEKANPVKTEVYPAAKLYCDDNGQVREIN
ncbi:MAG: hypothetical protein IKT05_02490 [Fibrobacter sp.]|nr:hypothetical protein [Fibrobacter sp.]